MRYSTRAEFLALVLALACSSGCNHHSTGYERYVPSVARAEEALDRVLTAWKNGDPIGPLQLDSAAITIPVADSKRPPGQRLIDYKLLGEISGEGPRTFVARLKFDQPSAEQEVRYYLVGIDPLWVFRQEDYEALIHWDVCEPDEPPRDDHHHTLAEQRPVVRTEGRSWAKE